MSGTMGQDDYREYFKRYIQTGLDAGRIALAGNGPPFLTVIPIPAPVREWEINRWVGCYVEITSGVGVGQFRQIIANTATTLFVNANWTTIPLGAAPYLSEYKIMDLPLAALAVAGLGVDLVRVGGVAQTGADWTPLLQRLNLDVTDLRDALAGVAPAPVGTLGGIQAALPTRVTDAQLIAGGEFGLPVAGTDGANFQFLSTDAAGRLNVNAVGGASEQFADGAAYVAANLGNVILGLEPGGPTLEMVIVDAAGHLQIDVLTFPAGLATEATVATLATEATLAAQLDITLSALRDALAGVAPATVATLGNLLDELMDDVVYAHTTLGVTGATQQALAANAARRYAFFQNDDQQVTQYLMVGAAAVASQGIRLNPGGGSYWMTSQDGNLDLRAVNVIGNAAGPSILLIVEGV